MGTTGGGQRHTFSRTVTTVTSPRMPGCHQQRQHPTKKDQRLSSAPAQLGSSKPPYWARSRRVANKRVSPLCMSRATSVQQLVPPGAGEQT